MENISKITSEELVGITGHHYNAGNTALEAQAELTRRLTVAIKDMEKSNNKYSDSMMDLNFILFVMTLLQVFIAIRSVVNTNWQWGIGIVMVTAALTWLIHWVKRERKK